MRSSSMSNSKLDGLEQKARAPRPMTSMFLPEGLVEDLKPIAQMKRVPFEWDASSYSALGRNNAPNQASLGTHESVLRVLIRHAKTGFPSHHLLRSALLTLHSEYGFPSLQMSIFILPSSFSAK